MLYRKISKDIEAHLRSGSDKIMVVEGARQIGKSFIIREVGNRLFKNFVEVNFVRDDESEGLFRNIHKLEEAENWVISPTRLSSLTRFSITPNISPC